MTDYYTKNITLKIYALHTIVLSQTTLQVIPRVNNQQKS